jgi:hypothetical protein
MAKSAEAKCIYYDQSYEELDTLEGKKQRLLPLIAPGTAQLQEIRQVRAN